MFPWWTVCEGNWRKVSPLTLWRNNGKLARLSFRRKVNNWVWKLETEKLTTHILRETEDTKLNIWFCKKGDNWTTKFWKETEGNVTNWDCNYRWFILFATDLFLLLAESDFDSVHWDGQDNFLLSDCLGFEFIL